MNLGHHSNTLLSIQLSAAAIKQTHLQTPCTFCRRKPAAFERQWLLSFLFVSTSDHNLFEQIISGVIVLRSVFTVDFLDVSSESSLYFIEPHSLSLRSMTHCCLNSHWILDVQRCWICTKYSVDISAVPLLDYWNPACRISWKSGIQYVFSFFYSTAFAVY